MKEDSDADMVLFVTFSGDGSQDEWILDLGYSYHTCPNMGWFFTYKSINGGIVLMGNNMPCKAIGIWMIKIKIYVKVLRTLTDIWHVPELWKNLISLGVLDFNGYKVIIENESMRNVKGCLGGYESKKGWEPFCVIWKYHYRWSSYVFCSEF